MKRISHTIRAILTLAVIGAAPVFAQSPQEAPPASLEQAKDYFRFSAMGEGLARYIGIRLYTARLYQSQNPEYPDAVMLQLVYHRNFKASQIIRASDKRLKRLVGKRLPEIRESYDRWNTAMQSVRKGDQYAILWRPDGPVSMYFNGERVLDLRDSAFAQAYLGIWLSREDPIDDDLRRELLADNPWPLPATVGSE